MGDSVCRRMCTWKKKTKDVCQQQTSTEFPSQLVRMLSTSTWLEFCVIAQQLYYPKRPLPHTGCHWQLQLPMNSDAELVDLRRKDGQCGEMIIFELLHHRYLPRPWPCLLRVVSAAPPQGWFKFLPATISASSFPNSPRLGRWNCPRDRSLLL